MLYLIGAASAPWKSAVDGKEYDVSKQVVTRGGHEHTTGGVRDLT
jgi:hypothetical protein